MWRLAVIALTLASLAMARRWSLETSVEVDRKARIIEVEASEPPTVRGGGHTLEALALPSSWPGKATYFVPAESGAFAEVQGICPACSSCQPPDGAFVRITSSKPVASWRLEVTSDDHDVLLDPAKELRTTFAWSAAGRSITEPTFSLVGDQRSIRDTRQGYTNERLVFWMTPLSERRVVTIRGRVSIEGPCPGANPCKPPPDAKLAFTRIVTEPITPPP